MWGYHEGMGWWFVLGSMWMVAFWAIVIGFAVWGLSKLTSVNDRSGGTDGTPVDMVQKRFANGEIAKEEFDDLMGALR